MRAAWWSSPLSYRKRRGRLRALTQIDLGKQAKGVRQRNWVLESRESCQYRETVLSLTYIGVSMLVALLGVPLMLGEVPPNRLYGFRTPKILRIRPSGTLLTRRR